MKKIVINPNQFRYCVNEQNTVNIGLSRTGDTIDSVTKAVTDNHEDITKADNFGNPVLNITNPSNTNDDVPESYVDVPKNTDIGSAIRKQVNPSLLSAGGKIKVGGDGVGSVGEAKVFSKKQIEEARIR